MQNLRKILLEYGNKQSHLKEIYLFFVPMCRLNTKNGAMQKIYSVGQKKIIRH